MKVMIVKELMTGDVSPVAMFFFIVKYWIVFVKCFDQNKMIFDSNLRPTIVVSGAVE